MTTLVIRNIVSPRGRTSIRLEPEFWQALKDVARDQGIKPDNLVQLIEQEADGRGQSRTSAVRTYLFRWYRDRARLLAAAPADASQ